MADKLSNSLSDAIAKKEVHVAKANCSYTYDGVTFKRTANFIQVIFQGFSSLPNGSSTICNIPSGFVPSALGSYDMIAFATNEGTSSRIVRVFLNTNGKVTVYNYGQSLSNNNAETSAMFIV